MMAHHPDEHVEPMSFFERVDLWFASLFSYFHRQEIVRAYKSAREREYILTHNPEQADPNWFVPEEEEKE